MLSRFFIARPKFALVISLIFSLVGVIAIVLIPIAEYPDVTPPQVVVTANYPGADSSLVEQMVAIPIEEQVNGVDNMLYMSSTSSNSGNYTLTITFRVGTDPDIAAVNVQNRVSLAEPLLPNSVTQQGVSTMKQSSSMLLVINLISPDETRDAIYLSNYASQHIQDSLSRLSGVGSVSQFGPLDYSMRVWMRPDLMTALNLTASDIANAISAQNVQATAGQIGGAPFAGPTDFQFSLRAQGLLKTAEEFGRIVVSGNASGQLVRLSDVANVELGARSYAASSALNNRPATSIGVYQAPGANALDVATSVYNALEEMKGSFPSGVEYELLYDVTKAVRASIQEIIITLCITAGLVVAVVFLFLMSWRAVLIPAIAIPVSLLGTLAILYLLGFSANLITLFGIILAITLVVDDSIVIIENTERIMDEEGLEPREATIKAMDQVTGPIIATTFVLLAVFVPVCFFPGITGRIYLQFALTITVAFSLSAVNALTLAPALCATLLKRGNRKPKSFLRLIPAAVDKTRDGYVWLVRILLKNVWVSLLIFVFAIVATVYMMRTTPTGFIPLEDKGVLFANAQLPDGASLQRSREVAEKMTTIMRGVEGVSDIISVSGFSLISGYGSNYVTLIAVLAPWDERKSSQTQWYNILANLNRELADVQEAISFVFPLPPIDGLGISGGISAQIQDNNNASVEDLGSVTNAMLSAASADPVFLQVFSSLSTGSPQYNVSIDRDKAEALGVNISDIFTALQANLGSMFVNNFLLEGKIYWVVLAAEASYRQTLDDIANIYVKGASGDMIPLSTLIGTEPILGPQAITRYNLVRTAAVQGLTSTGHSTGQGIEAFETIAAKTLPDGYSVEWTGVSLQEIEAGSFVIYIFLLAFTFAYLCLVAQYESWALPISVMCSTVFAVCGALIPLFLIDVLNNNIYAQIGIVLLIGLAAKKAIMLVEFSRTRREAGESIVEAAISAAHTRFRPVTMTGLCFIIGVLPLVFASGAGSSSRISIGLPVFTGMVIDSTIGLLMIPVLYVAIQRLRERRGKTPPATVSEETAT
ncbi:efflux RND transporter permease subunit [Hoeflea poritis]|uniref:Efflux pump membrane transporter n=1 Tax=Hoeflea poritis TaxID=2993659 RepID=A0ABT4VUR8_9HYPH|nr:efflux RND transporter permease subunit [Hoeflea poritis]MDA4848463.1 efflux RND transporter permease subunit [Hoeflea poritis]